MTRSAPRARMAPPRSPRWQVLEHPDRFWDVVLGTGYRGTIDALATDEREVVRQAVLAGVRERAITRLRTDVVFGTARRRLTEEA